MRLRIVTPAAEKAPKPYSRTADAHGEAPSGFEPLYEALQASA
jgi:hypothetical protein